MHIDSVKSLFSIMSGEENYELFLPIIVLAMSETEKMLRPDAGRDDVRLDFLSASIANFRYVQMKSAKDRTLATIGGSTLKSQSDGGTLGYAEKMMCNYLHLCGELVSSDNFAFISFGKV